MSDAVDEAWRLVEQGRPEAALPLIEPLARSPQAGHGELAAYAEVLRALDRPEAALEVYERARAVAPQSPIAEHNLASVNADLGRYADAEAAARRAFAKGLDAPETWLVMAHALEGQGRLDDAETAYRQAIQRRAGMLKAHRDLAQLIWMRTGDAGAAAAGLATMLRADPGNPWFSAQLAAVLRHGGKPEEAYDVLIAALARAPADRLDLELVASAVAADLGETVAACRHAEAALQAAPEDPRAIIAAADGHLGLGRPGPAARLAEGLLERRPDDQLALARLATAWRLMDDPRYGQLYDYDAMVRGWSLETPDGWGSLDAYLKDLAAVLRAAHRVSGQPYDQSLRGGSQTHADLARMDDPAVKALFRAVDGPIRQHMAALGEGSDPLRRRNTSGYRVQGAWSVRLRPQGFHVDHVHQKGWLSSALHIELPDAVADPAVREGWLKFGQPGVATQPPLPAERFVRPEPGRLVLFPSYMWHGTQPFGGEQDRLTVAFDVVPA